MKIWKIISLIRLFLLIFIFITLLNNQYYIEGGLLGIYILIEAVLSRVRELEIRLDNLENKKEVK